MTLPERVLNMLGSIDTDRARAIVKVTEAAVGREEVPRKPLEVLSIAEDAAIVIVRTCPTLARIPWLRTIAIAPDRHLLSVEPGTSFDSIEVALLDLMDDVRAKDHGDLVILEQLLRLVRDRRRDRTIRKGEILFVPPGRTRRRR